MEVLKTIFIYLGQWNIATVAFRLLVSLLCGGVIGITRSVKRRGAGFKTHVLVCLGATLIMMTGQYIYETFDSGGDISRLGAQVVSGVGFLGVGTIIVTGRNQIKGLTTAAGLWTCAGIGISIGIGFYSGAVFATVLVLIVYKFLGNIDGFAYRHARILDLYIELASRKAVTVLIEELKKNNYKIIHLDLNKPKKKKDKEKEDIVNAVLVVKAGMELKHEQIIRQISSIEGVDYVEEL